MERGECSTSNPPQANRHRGNAFDGITPFPSTSPAVVQKKKRAFDVFISHRGCDTKITLASAIYHTLDMNNIHAFLDKEELELGDSIPVEIQEAMDTVGLHITIFSKRYAESAWCLAELSYMLLTGTPIIPIFYHVDPSDLRWVAQGKGCYAPAFSQHEDKGRYPSNMLQDWKVALEKVSNLSGHVLNEKIGDEGMLLKTIVNSVLRILKKVPLEVAKHPVGTDKIVQDFERSVRESVENEQGVQIVGIVGLGGSGKTTLATEVYNRERSSINCSSFLYDVRDAACRNILHTKQKKLLQDSRIQTESFENVKEGKAIIADRLRDRCLLIVLDDVDHEDQIDALLPPKESIGRGSLVIITTREVDVLTRWGVTCIYKAKPLQHLHAKQLFCWHAFLQPFPLQGFEDLVDSFLKSCNGLPLSLKVIAGQLYGKRSREYWVSQLEKIQRILPNEIFERLKVSYDALDKEEQEIFLDVACFFIGEQISWAIDIWDASGWSGLCGWEALENKCLVEVDWELYQPRIRMHDHLRDLGRQIAKTHSARRFRVEQTPFEGIADSQDRRVRFEHSWGEATESTEKYADLLRGVLWLQWGYFKGTSIPSWLPLETIKFLEFYFPDGLELLWEDAHPPLRLRELRIVGAPSLQSLPRSIGHLKHLKKLFLVGASRLSSIPQEFGELQSLEDLVLVGCNGLSNLLGSIGRFHHLKSLSLAFQLTSRLCSEYIDIQNDDVDSKLSSQVSSLPEELCELRLLEHLDLQGCNALSSLPDRFGDLGKLRHLDLNDCKRLKRLPESFKQLTNFKYLNLDGCESLESLDNIPNLKAVYFHFDPQDEFLDRRDDEGQLSLYFNSCYIGRLLPAICQLSELKDLEIVEYGQYYSEPFNSLPIEISHMSSLQNLIIKQCPNLYEISELAGLVSLTNFEVKDCEHLQKIEGLEHLISLENLVVKDCEHLQIIEGLEYLTSLKNLVVKDCDHLQKIEGLKHLTSLENLVLQSRWWLEHSDWQGFELIKRLRTLSLRTLGDCIQNIEMETWPQKMTICTHSFSHFESILDSFTFPGVNVHRMGEWSSRHQQTNLSKGAVLYYLVLCQSYKCCISLRKGGSTRLKLCRGRWIVMSVFKEVSCPVEDGGGLKSFDISFSVEEGEVVVLGGWVMVGKRACVLYAFDQLFQAFSLSEQVGFDPDCVFKID